MYDKINKPSWKHKIDPAFPNFIKPYLDILEAFGLPRSEGYIHIKDTKEYLELIESKGFPGFTDYYQEENALQNIISEFSPVTQEIPILLELDGIFKAMSKEDWEYDIQGIIHRVTEGMNPESRDYYRRWDKIPSVDQPKEQVHFITDLISLTFHFTTKDYDMGNQALEPSVHLIQRILYLAYEVASSLVNKQMLYPLYEKAKKGDDNSLFELIRVDKSAFDHGWVRTRIRKALYEGDKSFFESLGDAIKKDPLKHKRTRVDMHLVLWQFWYVGLYRLTIPELMQVLEESGMKIHEDEVTFRKFIDREVKPYFKGLQACR